MSTPRKPGPRRNNRRGQRSRQAFETALPAPNTITIPLSDLNLLEASQAFPDADMTDSLVSVEVSEVLDKAGIAVRGIFFQQVPDNNPRCIIIDVSRLAGTLSIGHAATRVHPMASLYINLETGSCEIDIDPEASPDVDSYKLVLAIKRENLNRRPRQKEA
jgi:hypothetical protein